MTRFDRSRLLGLGGVALLVFSYASVLYHVTDVVGDGTSALVVLAASLAAATLVGRFVRPRTAVAASVLLLAVGVASYYLSVPEGDVATLTAEKVLTDSVDLLTGLSLLRLTAAGAWTLSVLPAPTFLAWYLAVREYYAASVAVAGTLLGVVVLTGDAGTTTTLLGVVGATVALGVGTLPSGDATGGVDRARRNHLETTAAVVAGMVVVSGTADALTGGETSSLVPGGGGGGGSSSTVESSLVDSSDSVTVLGSIRLSPAVRFVVETDEPTYWQTAVYDRYTGTGWVRTQQANPYDGRLSDPPGASRTRVQRVTARTTLGSFPAAWKPVELDESTAQNALQTPQGGIRPIEALGTGDSYVVTSEVPQYTSTQLTRAGEDYPEGLGEQYSQLPESTSQRLRDTAAEVTADAESPYERAVAVRDYLRSEKAYSLTVEQPDGDVADSFLFEMSEGYCVYYATTMVVMLRTQGIPSRFVVGYTGGEGTDEGFVVRGLDSHAWVQVYVPTVGWVDLDPTPPEPRRAEETRVLEEARRRGAAGSEAEPVTTGTSVTSTPETTATPESNGSPSTTATDDGGGVVLPELPDRETLALVAVAVVGTVAGARRTGVTGRLYRALSLRYQGRWDDPDAAVDRAFGRLERLLERSERPRRDDETARGYVTSVTDDERALAVCAAYEDVRYGPGVDEARARAVVDAVDELVRERAFPRRR